MTIDVNECDEDTGVCREEGYINTLVFRLDDCIDINECDEDTGVCGEGYINTLVFRLDDCVDINECREDTGVCGEGRCINTEGGYQCDCKPGELFSFFCCLIFLFITF